MATTNYSGKTYDLTIGKQAFDDQAVLLASGLSIEGIDPMDGDELDRIVAGLAGNLIDLSPVIGTANYSVMHSDLSNAGTVLVILTHIPIGNWFP